MGSKLIFRKIGFKGVEWIHPAQVRDRWRALVNAVMNLRVLAPRSRSVPEKGVKYGYKQASHPHINSSARVAELARNICFDGDQSDADGRACVSSTDALKVLLLVLYSVNKLMLWVVTS
jgi:hypothetical protein